MLSPSDVCNQNNLAVAALRQGCYHDALHMIREATVKMNNLYRTAASGDSVRPGEIKESYPIQSSPVGPMWGEPTTADQSGSSIFRRAIVLCNQEDSVPAIASVVLFNLGLCQHLLGTKLNSSSRIDAALKFYKMSYQIIEENRRRYMFGDLLVLAVINNIAESLAQSVEVKHARQWFIFLSQILGVATADEKVMPGLAEDDYVFFYINAMLHQGETLNVAPAA